MGRDLKERRHGLLWHTQRRRKRDTGNGLFLGTKDKRDTNEHTVKRCRTSSSATKPYRTSSSATGNNRGATKLEAENDCNKHGVSNDVTQEMNKEDSEKRWGYAGKQ